MPHAGLDLGDIPQVNRPAGPGRNDQAAEFLDRAELVDGADQVALCALLQPPGRNIDVLGGQARGQFLQRKPELGHLALVDLDLYLVFQATADLDRRHAFNRLQQLLDLGYSSAGTVVAVGKGLQGFQVGDRVACAGGGYAVHAEYAVVPQNLLAHLPPEVDFDSGAFATLGAIALHGFRLGEPQVGERVAVIGLGLLGLLSVGIARAAGCSVFGVDFDPRRVALACQMGAQAVLREGAEEAARSFSPGAGCDLVLICADSLSSDPVVLAGMIARDRARVVAVGAVQLSIPRKVYYEKELDFLVSRSYGPGRYDPSYE